MPGMREKNQKTLAAPATLSGVGVHSGVPATAVIRPAPAGARMLKSAYLKGANAAQLTTKYVTYPLMGGTSIHSNFVTFVKEA